MYPYDTKYKSEISNRELLKIVDDYFEMVENIGITTPPHFGEISAKATIAIDILIMNGKEVSQQENTIVCLELLSFLKNNINAKVTSQNQTIASKCREILNNLMSIIYN